MKGAPEMPSGLWIEPANDVPVSAAPVPAVPVAPAAPSVVAAASGALAWSADAERELNKIPFFVRGKARRNTERFANDRGVALITVETLYDAKAHFGR